MGLFLSMNKCSLGHGDLNVGKSATLPRRPAAFLDRDGILIVDDGYPNDPDKVQWIKGAGAAVRRLNVAGYFVFVVTNQAGVARGYYHEEAVHLLHNWMTDQLAVVGAHIDAFAYCPHHPEAPIAAYRQVCRCRKPAPGMIFDLMDAWRIQVPGSFLIGDRPTDLEAARAAGIVGHLVRPADLDEEVRRILGQTQ
ncbi:D-glycero-alpha-D-manno-heptose-1,7-bisphosphate 7-phosphatase [Acidisoma sp. 7E03]